MEGKGEKEDDAYLVSFSLSLKLRLFSSKLQCTNILPMPVFLGGFRMPTSACAAFLSTYDAHAK